MADRAGCFGATQGLGVGPVGAPSSLRGAGDWVPFVGLCIIWALDYPKYVSIENAALAILQ